MGLFVEGVFVLGVGLVVRMGMGLEQVSRDGRERSTVYENIMWSIDWIRDD